MATCKCEGGDEPWTGHLHDTCPLDQSDCQHNAKLNKETCDCEFCRYPWNGGVPTYAAGDVMRVHWGPHQGKKVTYVGRSQTNGAKVVVKLNGKDIEIDVNYVKYDDANRLKNAMAGHLGGGSTCSVCNRKVGDCLHGAASVALSTCETASLVLSLKSHCANANDVARTLVAPLLANVTSAHTKMTGARMVVRWTQRLVHANARRAGMATIAVRHLALLVLTAK